VVIAGAEAELTSLAELLDAPVATTVSGQGAISDRHPLAVGVVGSNGGVPETRAIVEEADLVMFVTCRAGSVTTERWRHPAPGKAMIVQIDVDPRVIGANYQPDATVLGDALPVLEALVDAVAKRRDKRGVGDAAMRVTTARKAKFDTFKKLAQAETRPIKPERIVATLQDVLPGDAIVVCDPGTPCPYFSAFYDQVETGRHFISNRAHGALGFAMSAAIGAHFGRPNATIVAVMGDGSFGMCVGELETIVRLNLPITLVVVSNSVFGWIKAGQKSGYEERYYSVDFSQSDHARIAAAYGVKSWTVENPADLADTLRAAVDVAGPSLVDIVTQPLQEAQAPVSEWVA
jgi:acetolactate synthase-1/2/3 large subunit